MTRQKKKTKFNQKVRGVRFNSVNAIFRETKIKNQKTKHISAKYVYKMSWEALGKYLSASTWSQDS